MKNNTDHQEEAKIEIIELYLGEKSEFQSIYILMVIDDEDTPIMYNEKIIFFSYLQLCSAVLELASTDRNTFYSCPQNVALVCDISAMITILESEDIDETATILNCLNLLFDLLKAINFNLRKDYERLLYDLADHLTFEREFVVFLEENKISRSNLIEAISLCINNVFMRSIVLTPDGYKKICFNHTSAQAGEN